jgi:hypothetical protein
MPKKVSKANGPASGPANGRTDIAEGSGSESQSELIGPDEIAARAYELYEREGRTDGRHLDHWYEAEQQLRSERQGRTGANAPQSGSQAAQPAMSRSARQMQERLPDTMAGAATSN